MPLLLPYYQIFNIFLTLRSNSVLPFYIFLLHAEFAKEVCSSSFL